MSERARLVASLPHGPRHPVVGTPPRRPGSVRRTTSIEQGWPDLVALTTGTHDGTAIAVRAVGRDLLTRPDGTGVVLDETRLTLEVDAAATVTAVATEPPLPPLAGLVGTPSRSGFRARAAALIPEVWQRYDVLRQLLEDVPLAALIASYGMTREHPEWNIPPDAAERLTDLCAGWAAGATMLGALETTGIFPIPVGPPAPELTDPAPGTRAGAGVDTMAWHEMGPLARRTVRRTRRLDVAPGPNPGDPIELDVHFRDVHADADATVDVLHEYTLQATLHPTTLVVLTAQAEARTLPWPECPAALASVDRVVGWPVGELPDRVAAELTGTSTCSHLNDLLRSVAGAVPLAAALTTLQRPGH